jgi:uncharacterized repeat protein (TIGR01451 family)
MADEVRRKPMSFIRNQSLIVRFTIAVVFSLIASLLLLGGVRAKRSAYPSARIARNSVLGAPQSSSTPNPESARGGSSYPDNLPYQSAQAFAPEAQASQVIIDFGNVPSGTIITNQYPPAVFSTDPAHYLFARNDDYWGSSFPNNLDRGPFGFPVDTSGYAPLYVNFTSPVNNLRFYMLAVDESRSGIAQVKIFQNGSSTPAAIRNVDGHGTVFTPLLIDVGGTTGSGGMGYGNVTRIEVVNITDLRGVAFDDFSFTIAPAPSPTPTPSPAPFPPANLIAEADKIKVSLAWDNSGATTYNVKRRSSTTEWVRIATGLQTTRFDDSSAIPDTLYFYAVSGVNNNGESADSNVVSATLVASCGDHVETRPALEHYSDRGNGWSMNAQVTDRDGLVLTDVSLNGRYMAEMMSMPYFSLKTNKMPVAQRGELTPDSASSTMRVRLLRYRRPTWFDQQDGHVSIFGIVADYAVDRITPTSKSCLLITQNYEFHDKGFGCEPSGKLPCSLFYPQVSYRFEGRDGEVLESMNVAQRMHYRVEGIADNTIGLLRDCDVPLLGCNLPGESFDREENPLTIERLDHVVLHGRDLRQWDNLHQTRFDAVEKPGVSSFKVAGCSECVHTHWRWAWIFGDQYGSGRPIIGYNANQLPDQDVDIGVARYRLGEEHPSQDFSSYINNESVRNAVVRITSVTNPPTPRFPSRRITVLRPADVVFWYSATSHEPISDLFFKHGSFFNPDPHPNMTAANASGSAANSPETVQDGIRSISYGHVYKEGSTTFSNVDPSTLAPLPAGYVPLDNRVYKIDTDGAVSGPHVVSFDVPSINDQAVFNDLAVFHLEQDPYDPENFVWVDDTILSPDSPASDFNAKIVNARVDDIGYFAVASLTQPQPDPGSSDLSITSSNSPDPAVVENNLTYALHVTNNGPQPATGVGIVDAIPIEVAFVSATASQGTCKFSNGSVYCKLGTLANGASSDVSIVVSPREDKTGVPPQGKSILNIVAVGADNDDSNVSNNSASQTTTLLPNPNSRPSVSITAPITGATYVGPANVTITATATDSDGSISQVDFYDSGTLIGAATPTGVANQYQRSLNPSFGSHTYFAVATDNGGRTNVSDSVNIFVDGTGNISITSPSAGSVFDPSASITVTANATNSSGQISKVEFFANSTLIGEGSATGNNQYNVSWSSIPVGAYTLSAILTDSSGVVTNSASVNVAVSNRPSVTILSPVNGTSYSLMSRVSLMATAQDSDGFVSKVDFYANGSLIASGSSIGQDRFTVDWTQVPSGIYSVTAVATDNLGVTNTSAAISIGVNTPSPSAGEFIWFDDDLPAGAVKHADGDVDWYWVDANPGAFSGTKAHQSRNFAQIDAPNSSFHQHSFDSATAILPVAAGDKLFTYVFLDANSLPREIMLEWKDANSWEHRAYWGANRINSGTNGTSGRRYMGPLPKAGTWVRLEIPASAVGLEGSTLNGMAFTLDGGRATWDLVGKATENSTPPPMTLPGDSVWVEDSFPAGAVVDTANTVNDQWNWVANPRFSGQLAHQSQVSVNHNTLIYRSHAFKGAQTQMPVNPGDVLFTYVFVDPSAIAQQIMLQWYDGAAWHRAYWGQNYIGAQFGNLGIQGTESQRYMGGLPPVGSWFRLEVPASYVGLEGKSVSGMAFSIYGKEPTVAWDRSGKSPQLTPNTVPLPLSATTAIWRLKNNNGLNAYDKNDLGISGYTAQTPPAFYAYPNQSAGTVPFYRFRRPDPNNPEYFYSQSLSYDGNGWILDVRGDVNSNDKGIAFYVYPNAATPGSVPLYLYHDSHTHYFLTTDQAEATGLTLDGTWGYVFAGTPPAAPSNLAFGPNGLIWQDNSLNETGFTIERSDDDWVQIGVVGPNVTRFDTTSGCSPKELSCCVGFRVRAINQVGASAYAYVEKCRGDAQPEDPPQEVTIPSLINASAAPQDLAIVANSIDPNSTSSIAKVEFFADGNKLGETTSAPYTFLWNSAPDGTHSLTALATNTSGGTFNPGLVVTDWPSSARIVSPANGELIDQNFAITANGFDLDGNGSITKVEFFANGSKVGEAENAPHVFTWNNAPAGTYSLVAKATDAVGVVTSSSPITVTVDAAPSVSITSPTNGAALNDTSVTINATASDSDGSVSKVEFFQGSTKLGEATSAPFNLVWSNVVGGSYSLTAVATDNLGRTTVSSPVAITVNNPPSISITTSSNQDVPTAPAQITINAEASDPDGTISKVEFYQGATVLGTDLTSPYSYTWSNVTAGNYSITAKATDSLGAVTTSITVSLSVNAKPSVSLTTPLNGNYFTAPAFVSITASASDPDGSIDRVEFYRGSTLISTVTTSPYTFNWSSVPAGTYTLTARAVDNAGASTTSSGVTITVTPNSLAIGKIAFASNRDGCAQIYLMDTDGTNQIRLTNDAGNDESPKWSPDNSRIVFQSDRDFQSDSDNPIYGWDIYVMNWDGSGVSRLTSAAYDDIDPVWSPDGTKIAFQSFRNGVNYQIYVMNADGSGQVSVSNNNGNDTQPSWSPDGTKIAFASDRDQAGFSSIYVMSANGSNQTRVTLSGSGFVDEQPAWSPDGMKLAFITTRDSTVVTWDEWDSVGNLIVRTKLVINKEIYVMNADGSSQVRLTNVMGSDDSPVWSPDGTKIVFRSDRDRNCCDPSEQIWMMNADGSNQIILSNNSFGDYCPSWSH